MGFSPQIIHFNKVFHYFHHPFWGPTPIFGNALICFKTVNASNVLSGWRQAQQLQTRQKSQSSRLVSIAVFTPLEDERLEPETFHPWNFGKSSSKPSFSGSMLNFWGCIETDMQIGLTPHRWQLLIRAKDLIACIFGRWELNQTLGSTTGTPQSRVSSHRISYIEMRLEHKWDQL